MYVSGGVLRLRGYLHRQLYGGTENAVMAGPRCEGPTYLFLILRTTWHPEPSSSLLKSAAIIPQALICVGRRGGGVFDLQLACVFSRRGSESALEGRGKDGFGNGGEGFRDGGAGGFEGEAAGGGGDVRNLGRRVDSTESTSRKRSHVLGSIKKGQRLRGLPLPRDGA